MSTTTFTPPLVAPVVPPTTLGACTRTFTYEGVSIGTSNGRDTVCTVEDFDPIGERDTVYEVDDFDPIDALRDDANARVAALRARLPEGEFSDALCDWEWSLAMNEEDFIGTDSVGREDTVFERWWKNLVEDQVRRVVPLESVSMVTQRASVLRGLVMQLDVARAAGSTITIEAVINVARAAFPRDLRGEALREAAIAGMCVMWAHDRFWVEAVAAEFDAAVEAVGVEWFTYRPDAVAEDSRMTRGEHGARRAAADDAGVAAWREGRADNPFDVLGVEFAPQPVYPFGTSTGVTPEPWHGLDAKLAATMRSVLAPSLWWWSGRGWTAGKDRDDWPEILELQRDLRSEFGDEAPAVFAAVMTAAGGLRPGDPQELLDAVARSAMLALAACPDRVNAGSGYADRSVCMPAVHAIAAFIVTAAWVINREVWEVVAPAYREDLIDGPHLDWWHWAEGA